jgi:hypothetical protein
MPTKICEDFSLITFTSFFPDKNHKTSQNSIIKSLITFTLLALAFSTSLWTILAPSASYSESPILMKKKIGQK